MVGGYQLLNLHIAENNATVNNKSIVEKIKNGAVSKKPIFVNLDIDHLDVVGGTEITISAWTTIILVGGYTLINATSTVGEHLLNVVIQVVDDNNIQITVNN